MKPSIALVVCSLGALFPAAASGLGAPMNALYADSGINAPDYEITYGSIDDATKLAARQDQKLDINDWKAHRTIFIGVGTSKKFVGDINEGNKLRKEVAAAYGYICPQGLDNAYGFSQCDWGKEWKVVNGRAGFTITAGANYWPAGHKGVREALQTLISNVFQFVSEITCGPSDDVQECIAKPNCVPKDTESKCFGPDKVLVRIDYIGWIYMSIKDDHYDGKYEKKLYFCDEVQRGPSGERSRASDDLVKWVHKSEAKKGVAEALGLYEENIKVEVKCD